VGVDDASQTGKEGAFRRDGRSDLLMRDLSAHPPETNPGRVPGFFFCVDGA
jgi:hypothetical protein